VHAYGAKSCLLEGASIERWRAFQVPVQIALDVIGAREQAQVGDAAQPLRQRRQRRPERRRGDVVQHVIADDDVEALARRRRGQRREVSLANVAASAVAPDRVRARLDASIVEMRALAEECRAPEPFSASDVERVARATPEQLLGERDDRASRARALGRGGNAMPRVTVPAIVIWLAEAVGQLALRGISTRSGACTLSR